MVWATFSHAKHRPIPLLIGIGLAGLAVFITLYYHYLQDPAFHQNAYALLTFVVVFRGMWVMEHSLRPWIRDRQNGRSERRYQHEDVTLLAEYKRANDRDEKILRLMWGMIGCGLSIFLGGFAIWTLDNEFCSGLRQWRHQIGLPWGMLLEGHGWWHIMTGVGAYFYITWGLWLRHCLNGKQDEYELRWPHYWSIPEVVRIGVGKEEQTGGIKKTI
ncbi:MAG: hypothetical protein M1834_001822 [Cirrosporium novae-zelandiae]|nr:MAG: hypothetical protein M1834_001822 [Cirrosporium novae-zelandiae]